ncbi:GSCFA domain-containing protein [Perlabentimonas gracilis]|uniref:GSCFA domain-containing protein n=1 Tax=Perlabentimonas gracilis TaxID=2715279 RepID=UPI00140A2B3B|nr:GSCFA domain-containing protein [Perlabentimonas gracilis]NHB69866.1 GSCFA domain-containing protein [Perlabentimonas gracilis]
MSKIFRTIVEVKQYPYRIGYTTPMLMLGSCFTDNIGSMLAERKFPVLINPFGVVYNPVSVALVLNRIISGNAYHEKDLLLHNNLWLSLHHHTSFSRVDKADCLTNINRQLENAHTHWSKAQLLIITFGTARIYQLNKTGEPVANCHKIPAKEFTRRMLSVDEIVEEWSNLLNSCFASKPNLKVLFTVSPVRHWKDGAHGNQLSKSTLLLAIAQLVDRFPENVFYYPSYEIMMDDLRDYRFYADDMLHPSPMAIEYIWEKFRGAFISPEDDKIIKEIESIVQACRHRPFNANTKEYKLFVVKTRQKIADMEARIPGVSFEEELLSLPANL